MDSATTTAIAALSGSFVGAMGSVLGSLITQRFHDRRDLLASQIARRETLYSDFIVESARLLIDALEHSVLEPKNLIPIYSLLSRIRLCASPPVLAAAEGVLKRIAEDYPKPNLTPEEIRAVSIDGVDPLKHFSEICRAELESVQHKF